MDIEINDDFDRKNFKKNKEKPENNDLNPLTKAIYLFNNKKNINYNEIIRILKSYLETDVENILAYKILGFCYIYTNKYEEAFKILEEANDISKNDVEIMNALSYINLYKGSLENSINYLLDAIYIVKDKKTKAKLKKNLDVLKKGNDPKILFSIIKPSEYLFINLPYNPFEIILKKFLKPKQIILLTILVLIIILSFILYNYFPYLINYIEKYRFSKTIGGNIISRVSINNIEAITKEREFFKLKYTEEEVKRKYSMVRYYLEKNKRNMALITINELLNSNASELVKEQVIILKSFVPDPDVNNIDYIPSCVDVLKVPVIYNDVFVRWSGMVANLEHKGKDETIFDLLINFVDDAVVEGIAEVRMEGFVSVMNGEKIAVFGNILGITKDNKILIKSKLIQRLGKKDERRK